MNDIENCAVYILQQAIHHLSNNDDHDPEAACERTHRAYKLLAQYTELLAQVDVLNEHFKVE